MGRRIAIASGKGGMGKTTFTASLGTTLCDLGCRVLLIDADSALRNLDLALGLENRMVYDIADVIAGRCEPRKAFVRSSETEGLYLLAGSADGESVSAQGLQKLTSAMANEFDFVLIDCPAGIEDGFRKAVCAADEAIIVATPDVTALRDACKTAGELRLMGFKPRLIANRCRWLMSERGECIKPEAMAEISNMPLLGALPEDRRVIAMGNDGESISDTRTGRAVKKVAAVIYNETKRNKEA